jgi:hypothetical protein
MMDLFITTDNVIRSILLISTMGVTLSTIEDLYRIDVFSEGGVLSWRVLNIKSKPIILRPFWKALDYIFEPSTFAKMLWLKLVASVSLVVVLLIHISPVVLAILTSFILFSLLLLNFRTVLGLDGAHHMNIVVFTASTLFFIAPAESWASRFCVVFIGAQAVLAYAVSGIAKLIGPSWRNGEAMAGIMSTKIYGHRALGKLFKNNPMLSTATGWSVMAFQCVFILTLFVDKETLSILLVLGTLFHVSTAVFMGLNGFVFSFVATYPAIIYLNRCIAML